MDYLGIISVFYKNLQVNRKGQGYVHAEALAG